MMDAFSHEIDDLLFDASAPPADGMPSMNDLVRACRDARAVALDRLLEIGALRDRVAFWQRAARALRDQGRAAAQSNAEIAADRLDEIRRLERHTAELEQALRTATRDLVDERHVREACEVQLADRDRRIAALREVFRDE